MIDHPTVDKGYVYGAGTVLHQRCTQCDWQQEGMSLEYWGCPFCGAGESALRTQLAFGGLTISETKKNHFELKNRYSQGSSTLEEADIAGTIVFLIKHNRCWPRTESNQNDQTSIKERPPSISDPRLSATYSMIRLQHLVVLPLLFVVSPWLHIPSLAFLLISTFGIVVLAWLDAKFWHQPPLGYELLSLGELWERICYMSLARKFAWSLFTACTICVIFFHLGKENSGLLSALWLLSLIFALAIG